ncbi:hypothetical protein K438DRAFT_1790937 [Mycena galopus ATCC 62051]|nr:hypothetical protein K438DRAFT_1790937 [Mycena galopus ATCC 62051]
MPGVRWEKEIMVFASVLKQARTPGPGPRQARPSAITPSAISTISMVLLVSIFQRAYISNSLYWKLVVLETENKDVNDVIFSVTRLWSRMEPNAPRYGGASQPPKYIHHELTGRLVSGRKNKKRSDGLTRRRELVTALAAQTDRNATDLENFSQTKLTGMLVSGRRDKEWRNGLTRRREVVTALAVVGENLVVRISETKLTGVLVSGHRDKERRNGLTQRREVVTALALAVVGENLVVRISEGCEGVYTGQLNRLEWMAELCFIWGGITKGEMST